MEPVVQLRVPSDVDGEIVSLNCAIHHRNDPIKSYRILQPVDPHDAPFGTSFLDEQSRAKTVQRELEPAHLERQRDQPIAPEPHLICRQFRQRIYRSCLQLLQMKLAEVE